MKNKFKKGQVVLYKNGDIYKLGVIKEVFETEHKSKRKQDGIDTDIFTGPIVKSYQYSVYYHTGDTAAIIDEYLLYPIDNEYAFKITRLTAD